MPLARLVGVSRVPPRWASCVIGVPAGNSSALLSALSKQAALIARADRSQTAHPLGLQIANGIEGRSACSR